MLPEKTQEVPGTNVEFALEWSHCTARVGNGTSLAVGVGKILLKWYLTV